VGVVKPLFEDFLEKVLGEEPGEAAPFVPP
jgi:hypothetical protein